MECNTVRLLLEFARPGAGELEPTEADALEAHLADCHECAALAQTVRQFDHEVGKAMRHVEVPDRLAAHLHARLDADNAERHRQRMFRAMSGILAAAVILVLLGVGYSYWRHRTRPDVDGDQVLTDLRSLKDNGAPLPEQPDEAFRKMGVTTMVPRELRY